jgi:hypothetical protein
LQSREPNDRHLVLKQEKQARRGLALETIDLTSEMQDQQEEHPSQETEHGSSRETDPDQPTSARVLDPTHTSCL